MSNETLIIHNFASAIEAKFRELADKKGLREYHPFLSFMDMGNTHSPSGSRIRIYYDFELHGWFSLDKSTLEEISESALPCVRALKRLVMSLSDKYFAGPVKVEFHATKPDFLGTIRAKIELVY